MDGIGGPGAIDGGETLPSTPTSRPDLFDTVQELVQVGAWEWHVVDKRLWWSAQTCRIFGLDASEAAASFERYVEAVHPDDRDEVWERAAEALAGGRPYDIRHRVVRPDGEVRYVRESARVLRDGDGNPVAMLGAVLDVTTDAHMHAERDEAVAALARSEEQYRLLAHNAYDVIWTMGVDGSITYVSPSVERVRGITPQEAMVQPINEIHPPKSAAVVADYFGRLYAAMAEGTALPTFHGEQEYYRKDGSIMVGELQVVPQVDDSGRVMQILGVTRDISAQRQAQNDLARSEQQFRLAMVTAPIGMAVVDLDRNFVQVNPALCRMLGRSEEWLLSRGIADIFADDSDADARDRKVRASLRSGERETFTADERMVTADGRELIVTHAVGLLRDGEGTPLWYVSQFVDITDTRRAQEHLTFLATHDPMTSLANRVRLFDVLEQALSGRTETEAPPCLLFIDLDDLKGINDTYGHAVGDQVIVNLAERVCSLIGPRDLAARIGGDEFVVLFPEPPRLPDAEAVAQAIRRDLADGLASDDGLIRPTVSIGLAYAEPGDGADDLLARADRALYQAKQGGRDRVATYRAVSDPPALP